MRRFNIWMAAALLGLWRPAPVAGAGDALPGVVRRNDAAFLIENHASALAIWHAAGVRGATLVHVDTHDDSRHVGEAQRRELAALLAAGDAAAVHARSDIRAVSRFEIRPADQLFDLGSFLYPCLADGIVARLLWVIPDRVLTASRRAGLQAHLTETLRLDEPIFDERADGSFAFRHRGASIEVLTFASLPVLEPGALLDLDIDVFTFAHAMDERHIEGEWQHDPANVCRLLRERVPQPAVVTVSASVLGGFVPLVYRFVADACFDALRHGDWPADAARLQAALAAMRAGHAPRDLPATADDPVYQAAFDHLHGLAALAEGRTAAARDRLSRAARHVPVYAKGLLDAAEFLRQRDAVDAAEDCVQRYEALHGQATLESETERARLALARGADAAAEALARRLADWNPSPTQRLLLGDILLERGRLDDATDVFTALLAQYPREHLAHYNLAQILERRGRDDVARAHYRRALALRPDFAPARRKLSLPDLVGK